MSEAPAAKGPLDDNPLSEREMEVARLLATGASNAEIARDLVISPHTVKVHVRNIFEKLHVSSRTEASMLLIGRGWLVVPGVMPSAVGTEEETRPDPPPLPPALPRPLTWQRLYLVAAVLFFLAALWAPRILARSRPHANLLTDAGRSSASPLAIDMQPRWEARTPLSRPVSRLAAAIDGDRLYVLGGEGEDGEVLDSAAAYDLKFNEWTPLPLLPEPLSNAAAAAVDGKLYVAGGTTPAADGESLALSSALWVYEPTGNAWSKAGILPGPLAGAALVAGERSLYLIGGWDGGAMRGEVWRLALDDEGTEGWQQVGELEAPRAFLGATRVEETLYIVGGYDGGREYDRADAFDLPTGEWRSLPPLSTPRGGLALVYDGLALFALGGGWTLPITTHERYDPATGVWSNSLSPIEGEWRNLGAAARDGHLHLLGGWSGRPLDTHFQYQSSFRALLPVITK